MGDDEHTDHPPAVPYGDSQATYGFRLHPPLAQEGMGIRVTADIRGDHHPDLVERPEIGPVCRNEICFDESACLDLAYFRWPSVQSVRDSSRNQSSYRSDANAPAASAATSRSTDASFAWDPAPLRARLSKI